jgi:hypothetical protein
MEDGEEKYEPAEDSHSLEGRRGYRRKGYGEDDEELLALLERKRDALEGLLGDGI